MFVNALIQFIYSYSREGLQGTMNFKSTRNYIVYDEEEQVVRFAMTSEIEPLKEDGDDPCQRPNAPICEPHSYCLTINSEAQCVCDEGYEPDPNNVNRCLDVDECRMPSLHQCDVTLPNSQCINTPGSYKCACGNNYIKKNNECVMVSKYSFIIHIFVYYMQQYEFPIKYLK